MRQLKTLVILVVVLLALTACQGPDSVPSDQDANDAAIGLITEVDQSKSTAIQIQGPMTVSHNSLFPYVGEDIYLDVALVEGRYDEDWNPGALMGRNWQGNFQFIIRDDGGNILRQIDIDRFFFQQVTQLFELSFADYNRDGDIDFALGQYASSNGNDYQIYTIRDDYSIEKLEIADRQHLFASGGNRHAIEFELWGDYGFENEFYDNTVGKNVTNHYAWENNQFKLQSASEQ